MGRREEMNEKPLCFVTGLQLPAIHEMNSCWSGFCTLIWQWLNQIAIYRLGSSFRITILFCFCLVLNYFTGIMPSICIYTKNLPPYKARNYFSTSVSLFVIIFFEYFEIYTQSWLFVPRTQFLYLVYQDGPCLAR